LPSASEIVAQPTRLAEAAEIVARANGDGSAVSIDREGGDVVLSTSGLDRILEHEAGDLTATVEAGVRLSALNAVLGTRGQMLALDPPGDPTIGACLAAALSGPRRHRYGAARDLVLGVTVVLGDGTVASAGGKVVKNVAGYDMGKLFCGSRGRFGLIARASLRLHPLPEASGTLLAAVADAADAHRLWQLVHRSALVPSAVDLFWRGRDDVLCYLTQAPTSDASGMLALLFEGSGRAVKAQLEAAGSLLGGEAADDRVWEAARTRQGRLGGTVSFPPGRLAAALGPLPEALVRPGIGAAFVPEPLGDRGDAGAHALAERVRAVLDPSGTFVHARE
jgi:glycolate dehydrogenase FAD-binding subunit